MNIWDEVSIHEAMELGLQVIDPTRDWRCRTECVECGDYIPSWQRSPRCDLCRELRRREVSRQRSRRSYRRMTEDEDRMDRRRAYRRRWWRERHPVPVCEDCGERPATSRHSPRCAACRVTHRRRQNARRQRKYKQRKREMHARSHEAIAEDNS
jgi:hypothetical protein